MCLCVFVSVSVCLCVCQLLAITRPTSCEPLQKDVNLLEEKTEVVSHSFSFCSTTMGENIARAYERASRRYNRESRLESLFFVAAGTIFQSQARSLRADIGINAAARLHLQHSAPLVFTSFLRFSHV